MSDFVPSISKGRRKRKIDDTAKNQLSHRTDIPRKRVRLKRKRVYVREIPFSAVTPNHLIAGLPIGVTPHTYLPPAERTYVDGRDWTIG